LLLHQSVYFHRTVRAIDLDLGEVFQPAIEALFGDDSPADRLADYVDLDEYALLHQAARWARGEDVLDGGTAGGGGQGGAGAPGGGRVSRAIADGWRGILLRRPGWRAEAEFRASYEPGGEPADEIASLGSDEPGRVAIDLAVVDARPGDGRRLAVESRDGGEIPLSHALARVPAYALIGRRYRRTDRVEG
jgi:hypothetical protein